MERIADKIFDRLLCDYVLIIRKASGLYVRRYFLTFEQMEEQQKNYKKLIDTMRDYILERTKIDVKLFNRNKSKDWYLTDKEQVELGVVNEIVASLDDIL